MNQGNLSASGAVTHPKHSSLAVRNKGRHDTPQPVRQADGTWSIRARRMGTAISLSGFPTPSTATKAMASRLRELAQTSEQHGLGPDRTTVGQAMQHHALEYLSSLKGAAQEARRINTYLRAAKLATIKVRRIDAKRPELPANAVAGRYFAVWLEPDNTDCVSSEPVRAFQPAGLESARAILVNKVMATVSTHDVQAFVCALEEERLACATVLRERQLLRRLFDHAARRWYWATPSTNPVQDVRVHGRPAQRKRVMSVYEQQFLEQSIKEGRDDLLGPAFAFLCETGMKARDCINTVRWGDVDWDRQMLRLGDRLGAWRSVPLSSKALDILRTLRAGADLDQKIFPIGYASLRSQWKRACERAGIRDLLLGDLRRTAALRMFLTHGFVFELQHLTGCGSSTLLRLFR